MDSHAAQDSREAPERPDAPSPAPQPRRRGRPGPADIAIVGISAILPDAPDLRRYWENILDQVSAIREVPADRWPAERYFDADRDASDKIVSKSGGFLPDIAFDPTRYGIPPASVPSIDPAQLLALVAAEAALADAGLTEMGPELRRRAAVILGFTGGLGELGLQYAARAELARALPDAPAATLDFLPKWTSDSFSGLLPNVVAGRIANRFDLGGANFVVDAACGTSLAALRQAVLELESGRSDVVLCGAVEAGQGPFAFTCFSKSHALSPQGRCRALDAAADGTAIAEGVAMLVLRRLEDAQAAGERIYAVIKGIDGSSDGRARSMMAPLPEGQKRAARSAYDQAGYSPASVELFEAHGTGTVSGDAAEIESLSTLLREAGAAPRAAAVGSVKALIGHAEGAAGLAGLLKVVLGLHHKVLPPHAGVERPNPALSDPACPIALQVAPRPWLSRPGAPRRAGVSAFGFGGANFHVTLEEAAGAAPRAPRDSWPVELFVWQAPDRATLAADAAKVQAALAEGAVPDLGGLAQALARACGAGSARLAIVAGSHAALATLLGQAIERLRGGDSSRPLPPGVYLCDAPLATDGRVAMLFSGQGSQYPDMGRELAVTFPEVAAALASADAVLAETPTYRGRPDPRLSGVIYPLARFGDEEEDAARRALAMTDVAQPALGALELAMLALTVRLDIVPSMVAGHSYGEYAALHAAGVLGRDDLLRVSEARGRFIVGATQGGDLGTMAAVSAPSNDVRVTLGDADGIVLANINAPNQTVISGSKAAIAAALERLGAAGLNATPIPVSAAFHSPLVQPAEAPLAGVLDEIAWAAPRIPVFSNTTAAPHAADPAQIKALLAQHLTRPVDFVGMIEAMYGAGARVFLEVGPKTVLTGLTRRILGPRPHAAVALDGAGGGIAGLLHALAAIMVQGVQIDPSRLFEGRDLAPIDLVNLGRDAAETLGPWVLNGTRARKAGAPITVAVPTRAEAPKTGSARDKRNAAQGDEAQVREIDRQGLAGAVPLGGAEEPQDGGRDQAMVEHQRTMQQFLQMQERLMMAYLGGGERRAAPRPFSTPRPAPAARQIAPRPPAYQAPATPAPVSTRAPAPSAPPPAAAAPPPVADPKALLLQIAAERTGYPEDMLGLDLNMEADLGIDSIKRVEILAAFRKAQPQAVSDFLQPRMTQIAKAMTLQEVLDRMSAALKEMGDAPRPFDRAGSEPRTAALTRYVMRAAPEPLPPGVPTKAAPGIYLVAPGHADLTAALTARLEADGAEVRVVPDGLATDDIVQAWLASVRAKGRIRGLVGLAATASFDVAGTDSWRAGMAASVKSLFPLLRFAAPDLAQDGIVIVASTMGGQFGRDALSEDRARGFPGAGGGVGLVKSLAAEWPDTICKAIDLDPADPVARQAAHLHAEIAARAGRREVGYPAGARTIFRTVDAPLGTQPLREAPDRDWVVVAIGGARGITAETLFPFAAAGATCVVVGRTPLPAPERPETAALRDAAQLRAHFLQAAAAASEKPTPAAIQARIARVLRERETRANVALLEKLGGRLDARRCDVTSEAEICALFTALYAHYGRIDAVLLGAGLIDDKLIVDKTRESLDRVFDTKVDGAFFVVKHLRPETLKFLALFSSVAGRYGNRGQADYAAANEVLNRYAWQLQARFGGATKVVSVNWGAWAATTNGPGMLTPETARQFRERGLRLIEPLEGRRFLIDEYLYAPIDQVEVVAGEHAWEAQEAAAAAPRTRTESTARKVA